jgi:hypothetical protein
MSSGGTRSHFLFNGSPMYTPLSTSVLAIARVPPWPRPITGIRAI